MVSRSLSVDYFSFFKHAFQRFSMISDAQLNDCFGVNCCEFGGVFAILSEVDPEIRTGG
jgi:hypothetical protein